MQILQERWYLFAAASGVLLMLTFYPFHFFPLGFVALVPAYLATLHARSKRTAFLIGCIAGGMVVFEVSFLMVAEFHWLPEATLFVASIQYGGVAAATLLFGGFCGLWALGTYLLYSRSVMLNTLMSAALYLLFEQAAQLPVGGYFIPTLVYEIPLPIFLSFASIAGALFVSFLIAWINFSIAEGIRAYLLSEYRRWARDTGVVILALFFFFVLNSWYLSHERGQPIKNVSVSVIQLASIDDRTFGTTTPGGEFVFPQFKELVAQAGRITPDLILYPGSIQTPTTEENDTRSSAWVAAQVPPGSALLTWDNVSHGGVVTSDFRFWSQTGLVGDIEKKVLVPFFDYAPQWARGLGFYPKLFDIAQGQGGTVSLDGIEVGGLVCSEVHSTSRSREDARVSSLIIAMGSEAMFEDDVASGFSLRAAQYRAAEGDLPVVRSTLIGPTAIIDHDGSIIAEMPIEKGGILSGQVVTYSPHQTLYTRFGDTPFIIGVVVILLCALRTRFPGKQE